jgi:hypothetical protein
MTTTPPRPTSRGEGIAASLVTPGLTSSLFGSGTFDSRRGLGSAFPGAMGGGAAETAHNTAPLFSGGAKGGGGARGDLRSKLVRERSRSSAAFASSSLQQQNQNLRTTPQKGYRALRPPVPLTSEEEEDNYSDDDEEEEEQYPALFTNFCYRGMEVIFTAIPGDKDHQCHLLGIHARTRAPFQKCHFGRTIEHSNYKTKVKIVELTSHPLTGWIFAADSIGNVHSFYPTRADPMKVAYGKFRWVCGSVANTRMVFGYSPLPPPTSDLTTTTITEDLECFHRKRQTSSTMASNNNSTSIMMSTGSSSDQQQQVYPLNDGQPPLPKSAGKSIKKGRYRVMVRSSLTNKRVLVVHKDQLAIFDFSKSSMNEVGGPEDEALLLWTHFMQGSIITQCSLSGDGCAIAVALEGEGVGVPYPFGIRTFVRDWEDGSSGAVIEAKSDVKSNNASNMRPPTHKHRRTASGMKALPESHAPPLPSPKNKNFDSLMDSVFGDVGAAPTKEQKEVTVKKRIPVAAGILYKPGQFLVHSSPVTRLSFRGFGTRTSALHHNSGWNEQEEGNDLLLTSCSNDCSVRIFSQNSWRQLMHWTSPPKSRADWVRGISAANIGDLDSSPTNDTKKKKKDEGKLTPIPKEGVNTSASSGQTSSTQQSQQSSMQMSSGAPSQSCDTSVASDASGGRVLVGNHHYYNNYAQTSSSFPSHSVPGTHAGAWIAELTFRNAFPALRLSRLSYMKTGGDDALPAHFESVAAILPPGSLNEGVLLAEDDAENCMDVEGIWPVWDCWEPDLKKNTSGSWDAGNDKPGSGAFGGSSGGGIVTSPPGASPTAVGPRWVGDGFDLGGTHIPPSEIRITSSSSRVDCLAQIEMPLWGDKDFGAMEFGAPMRYVMSMPERRVSKLKSELPCASLEYESGSRLCARATLDNRSIELLWRRHGAINLERQSSAINLPEVFRDLSLTPLPICLPSLSVPGLHHKIVTSDNLQPPPTYGKHAIASLHWWPDENFGGPPRLVALTQGGTLIVYEMPPPWSALEPPMPSYDPFDGSESRGSSVYSDFGMAEDDDVLMSQDSFHSEDRRSEYEVAVAPHPDFGLGLRLEAQAQGMAAIAGSFKKHPLSGGRLPAERSGAITLGDELIAVNDVNLEGCRFEDAIATVRQIGFDSHGEPLRMRFRRCRGKRLGNTLPASIGSKGSKRSGMGVKSPDSRGPKVIIEGIDDGSLATVEVGADAEYQQEFGRIIAVVRDAIIDSTGSSRFASSPAMLLLPWNFGKGAVVSNKMYGGALVLWAVPGERTIKAARLEALLDIDPENARFDVMGSVTMDDAENNTPIRSITFVSSTEKGWLVTVSDSLGNIALLFIEICSTSSNDLDSRPTLTSSFRQYSSIFNLCNSVPGNNTADLSDSVIMRPFSLELFGFMKKCIGGCKELKIFSALPYSVHMNDSKNSGLSEYSCSTISLSNVIGYDGEFILDFCWVSSGFEDAFPWLLVFTQSAAILYHRSCLQNMWGVTAIISYTEKLCLRSSSPLDVYPHLVTALRSAIPSNDERTRLRSGWHPESILASICTDENGTKLALNSSVRCIYDWLSQWMVSDESSRPSWVGHGSLSNAPFRVLNDKKLVLDEDEEENGTSAALMAALSLNPQNLGREQSEAKLLLSELQSAINAIVKESPDLVEKPQTNRSKEFVLAMSQGSKKSEKLNALPIPLQKLTMDELRCLWAIGEVLINPPPFKKLDSNSQLSLFCVALMRNLLDGRNNIDSANFTAKAVNAMPSYEGGRMVMSHNRSSSNLEGGKTSFDNIASAGCLSALMSDSQMLLVNSCRPIGEKFNWDIARSIGLPFWLRSQKELLSIAEEIAQTIYKDTRSVMDCALYYIAMRNMKKLRAIAATDRSDSGKKFFKFISDHDFSSDRGRSSAEKNAYSLLRKRKYASAASFFLLAEPPMIKSALDVIRLQLQDTSLAFFVARLIENAIKSCAPTGDGLTIGGGFNLSSMGGGGGFAGSGGISIDISNENVVKFEEWEPDLGSNARAVLEHKAANAVDDVCLESLKLLWLGRRNEAKLRLAHIPAMGESNAVILQDLSLPSVAYDTTVSEDSSSSSVLRRANAVINFCSGPTLLKGLNPKKRVLWSSALLVSRALGRCGIEIPSMRILQRFADPLYDEKSKPSDTNAAERYGGTKLSDASMANSSAASSSIFDSFDTAPSQRKQTKPAHQVIPSSSIFDSYAPAPPSQPASSIFDSFDAVPQKPKSSIPAQPASIFDSFDTAPQRLKPAPSQTDNMSSSIFDSFDVAPQKPKPAPKQSDDMSSSIFDSFDVAPQKPKPASKAINSQCPPRAAVAVEPEANDDITIPDFPSIWVEWRERLIHLVVARTLLREMARIVSSFHGDPHFTDMEIFAHRSHPIIPTGAAEVLHNSCDSQGLLNSVYKCVSELSEHFRIDESTIIQQAWELLSSSLKPRRIIFAVLLQCLLGRGDVIEDLVRDAASHQTNSAEFLGLANDTIIDEDDTKYYLSSQFGRRECANIVWQLELCLWLHRGGAFEMSVKAVKETVLAIRIGIATSSWGRCHQSLDTLLKAEPDYPMDFDGGKNLWRSMKIIVVNDNVIDGVDGVSSGGWEFLVDCRRDEATEMLRDGKPGQFLIRPHAQDPGVFTLSFRTNLVPTEPKPEIYYDEAESVDKSKEPNEISPPTAKKIVKRDDVVQHAIVRLTDSGFRCGSFGPFVTLVKLLHAVSESLPFALRFNDPPIKGFIKERGALPSPNSFLFRKMALHSKSDFFQFQGSTKIKVTGVDDCIRGRGSSGVCLERCFGLFAQLLFLTELRKQLCALAAAVDEDAGTSVVPKAGLDETLSDDFDGSISEGSLEMDEEEVIGVACRMVRPLLNWVRSKEIDIVDEIAPLMGDIDQNPSSGSLSSAVIKTGESIEHTSFITGGDSLIRRMIQAGSGVEFRTLRVGEAGNSVIVVLFGKNDAVKWMVSNGVAKDQADAEKKLKVMELMRIIEPITSTDLSIPKSYAATHPATESRYRFVDPWEVEALESKAGETANAALGRARYRKLSVGQIASSCEKVVRATGGLHLLGLWSTLKGGITLTKALCSAHPPWERDAGGDLLMKGGFLLESSPYENSIRQHLYGNSLFRRLNLPQRFLALLQVELLDLKNVTSPSGSSSLTAYALLRLKRQGSSAPLNHKARSLDSACTEPRKISKSSGLNAPASWGSLVRFRFPLPEFVNCEGKSFDADRESLFRGPPTCLQVTAYEKKFMSDAELGGADINLESLGSGGQIEEWVPLRAGKDGITWFARIRISLRFELMCLELSSDDGEEDTFKNDRCPSVGLKKIQYLSRLGAHEDVKGVKNSISTPDLPGYFGSMLY